MTTEQTPAIRVEADGPLRIVTLNRPETMNAFDRGRLASLPPQAVQDTKLVLNQLLRERAAAALPFGLAAESQSSDTAEYAEAPARLAAARAARRSSDGGRRAEPVIADRTS